MSDETATAQGDSLGADRTQPEEEKLKAAAAVDAPISTPSAQSDSSEQPAANGDTTIAATEGTETESSASAAEEPAASGDTAAVAQTKTDDKKQAETTAESAKTDSEVATPPVDESSKDTKSPTSEKNASSPPPATTSDAPPPTADDASSTTAAQSDQKADEPKVCLQADFDRQMLSFALRANAQKLSIVSAIKGDCIFRLCVGLFAEKGAAQVDGSIGRRHERRGRGTGGEARGREQGKTRDRRDEFAGDETTRRATQGGGCARRECEQKFICLIFLP